MATSGELGGVRPPSTFFADINMFDEQCYASYFNCLADTLPMVEKGLLMDYQEIHRYGGLKRPAAQLAPEDIIIKTTHETENTTYAMLDRSGKLYDRLGESVVRAVQAGGIEAEAALYARLGELDQEPRDTPTIITSDGLHVSDRGTNVWLYRKTSAEAVGIPGDEATYPLLLAGFSEANQRELTYTAQGMPRITGRPHATHILLGVESTDGFVPMVSILGPTHEVVRQILARSAEEQPHLPS